MAPPVCVEVERSCRLPDASRYETNGRKRLPRLPHRCVGGAHMRRAISCRFSFVMLPAAHAARRRLDGWGSKAARLDAKSAGDSPARRSPSARHRRARDSLQHTTHHDMCCLQWSAHDSEAAGGSRR